MPINLVDKHTELTQLEQLYADLKASYPDNSSISVVCEAEFYTMIPATVFKPEASTHYLKFHHPSLPDTSRVFHTHYKDLACVLVYAIDDSVISRIQAVNSDINIQHHLHALLSNPANSSNDIISVFVRSKFIDCITYQKKQLTLLNSYPYNTEEDIVYHVLNIFHHLNLDYQTTELELCAGDSQQVDPEHLLKNYLPNTNRITIQPGI